LVAFLMLSSALAWSRGSEAVTAVTTIAALMTAIVLMVQTGDLAPFAAAILGIACVVEASSCRGRARGMRVPAALAADFALWLIYFVMTRPGGVPEQYKPVSVAMSLSLGAALLAIYSVSVVWQSFRRAIGVGEILQMVTAFTLAAGGALMVTQGRAVASVGALCALAGAACYFTAFLRFDGTDRRNHHVFAFWGAALGLVACVLILPLHELTLILGAAAVLTVIAGARASRPTLRLHGVVYLIAAALISRYPSTTLNAFTGETLEPATSALWIVAGAASCCYLACFFATSAWAVLDVIPAILTAASIGALLLLEVVPLIGREPTPSFLAAARTLILCALALLFAYEGWRTARRELTWVSYAIIALCTGKLIVEDFRQSRPAALVVSLVSYGAVLILVPKLRKSSDLSADRAPQ
jgi:hypothetical protein